MSCICPSPTRCQRHRGQPKGRGWGGVYSREAFWEREIKKEEEKANALNE